MRSDAWVRLYAHVLPYICWSNPWAVHSWQGEFWWSLVFAFCYKIPRSFSWTNVSSPRPWEHLGQGNPCDFPPSVWQKTRMIKTCFNTLISISIVYLISNYWKHKPSFKIRDIFHILKWYKSWSPNYGSQKMTNTTASTTKVQKVVNCHTKLQFMIKYLR